ncbi:MAG: hypothetical protein OXC37_01920, partial [Bdellovibrionaceae bacterium]|nr:hypothetical protein [Pseudobdellovibrionaceae bacterium]
MLEFYKNFQNKPVFKRFRQILEDWWNLDIVIVVKKADSFFCESVSSINNPTVKLLFQSDVFKNYFFSSLKSIKFSEQTNLKSLNWKQTGLDFFAVPLSLKFKKHDKSFLAVAGFFPKRAKEFKQA